MLYIPKIDDYLKILTGEEVKDFVAINFSEYFKSIRGEQNLRKIAKSPYIFQHLMKQKNMYNHILLVSVYIPLMLSF